MGLTAYSRPHFQPGLAESQNRMSFACGIPGIQFQHLQIIDPRPRRIMQLLGVKIAQGELRPDFAGTGRRNFFQLVQRVGHIARCFKGEREIITRIHRIRPDGQCRFISQQGAAVIPQPIRQHTVIILRLKPAWIKSRRLVVCLHCVRPARCLFEHLRLGECT